MTGNPRRSKSLPTLQNFLIFSEIVVGVALIEGVIAWIVIVTHLLIISQNLFLLVLFVLALLDLGGAMLFTWRTAEPRAIRKYIQDVRDEQERYRSIYTPLSVLTDVYETSIVSQTDPAHIHQQSLQELVRQQDRHLLFLGLPGAGKTMALRVYQHIALEQHERLVHGGDKIPVFIPMKDYNAFLREINRAVPPEEDANRQQVTAPFAADPVRHATLLDYLYEGELKGIRHLRPYLKKWIIQGRILFLCDGLNEVDSNYLDAVCKELIGMMQKNQNRLVMTCRELDYREQPVFASLVGEEYTLEALITPLRTKQIEEFVNQYITEGYVNEQDERWNYTSDEVIGLIKETRLRYECTNPLMLFTLMKTINSIGVERGKQIDTRGRLLQEFVSQLIQRELEKPKWTKLAFTANELTLFLSQVACTARRMKYRNAVPLSGPRSSTGSLRRRRTYREMAVTLDGLLVDPTVVGVPIADEEVGPSLLPQPFKPLMLAKMLEFAESAALISISQDTLLSFRHELIAEYYVAEYLCEIDNLLHQTALPFGPELIKNVGDWNEPIRIWADLLPDPMALAKRLAGLGLDNSNYGYNALTLSMMCIGVRWAPPQGQTSPQYKLPRSVGELLTRFVMDEKKQEKLAATFNQCAQEGGEGVYRSLLPFIEYQGIDELLLQLDKRIVPGLVFEYLRDAIDRDAFENVIPHLIRVLGGFGDIVVEPAVELSKVSSDLHELSSDKHVRLRKAAIAVLGRTDEQSAVEPLMAYLGETEVIRNEAVYALIRLGPELALESELKELASRRPTSPIESIHWATLAILEGFLGEQYALQPHSAMQHQTIIEARIGVLHWSPDGSLLAAGADNGALICWRTDTYTIQWQKSATQRQVYSLAWSPDSTLLAVAFKDKHVVVWNVREDRIQTEWKLPVVPRVLSISRQGLLVVASNSSELFLGRLDERFPSAKHPGYWLAAWSPKRLELATLDARDETTLLIWQE